MSVTRIVEKYASGSGSATVKGRRQYTRVLLMICSSTSDDEHTIFGAAPSKYASYPSDSGARCKKVEPKRGETLADGSVVWECVCHYDSQLEEPDQDEENPLNRPQIEDWSGAMFTETQFEDLNEDPYINSVGDPLDPPPLVETPHSILVIQRNESSFSPWLAHYYRNKVNSDGFYGAGPKYAKVASIGANGPNYENGVVFYVVRYEIHFNPAGWIPTKILDAGPRCKEEAGDEKPVHPKDKDGTQSTANVLLRADGTQITWQQLRGGEAPHYLEFEQYELAPFSGMNL